ncbi:hypothetical protein Tco_1486100 [Tanacetum coccineum]
MFYQGLLIKNERLLEQIISQDIVCTTMHSYDDLVKYAKMEESYIDEYSRCVKLKAELSKKKDMVKKAVYNELSNRCSRLEKRCISLEIKVQQSKESFQHDKPCNNQDAPEFLAFFEINNLKAQLQAKNTSISKLKEHIATLKGKSVPDYTIPVNNSNVIASGMFKLDLPPISPKLKKNKEAHELLVYVSATCSSSRNESEKLVTITPINKNRKVRFTKPSTSTSNTQKQDEAHSNQDTNKPLLPSTGVKSSTNASRLKPRSNTRNNRILRISSSNKKNKKVEDVPRNVKSSLNNTNRVSVCNANVKHDVLNANSKFVCSTCNECLFNASHDMCVVNYLNAVNSHTRAKSGKINKKNEWKPTGKVFTKVVHRWLPTGRTFTIDGTKCPLTRITSTKVVPPRKPVQTKVINKTPPSSVSQGKPNETKSMSSSSNPRIVESRHSNNSKPNQN